MCVIVFFFFFLTGSELKNIHDPSRTCSQLAYRHIPGITNDLPGRRSATITAHTRACFEERQSKSLAALQAKRTRQRKSQASGSSLNRERFPTNFSLRQMPHHEFRPTIGPRLHTPDVLSQTRPTILGDVSPSFSWLWPKKPRPPSYSVARGHHHVREETPWWCRWPAGLHGATADHQ